MKIKIYCRSQQMFLLVNGKNSFKRSRRTIILKAQTINFINGVNRFDLRRQSGSFFISRKNKINIGIESQIKITPGFINDGPHFALPYKRTMAMRTIETGFKRKAGAERPVPFLPNGNSWSYLIS